MKKYAAIKPSGVEWLGDVPAHWEVKRLKFIINASLMYGANEAAEFDDTNWPRFVRITDVNENGTLRKETFKSLPPEVAEPYLLTEGDILLARSGATVGKSFKYEKSWGVSAFAGYLIRARIGEQALPAFVAFYLKSSSYWQWVNSSFIQSTIQNLSAERYANLEVPLPPLDEQRAIAYFLDARTTHLGGLIRRKEDLLKLLAEQRAALITSAVTRGLDAAAPLRDSGVPWLGQVPVHWEVKRLKFVADVHSGIAKGKKYLPNQELIEVPYLRVANVQDGFLNLSDIATISVTPAEAEAYQLLPMDILMNEGGDNDKLGRGTVWEGQITPCIHQNHVFAIRHNGTVDSWFLSYFFGSNACKPYFFLSGNQATNLASISSSAIADTPFPMPPLNEQREIVKAVDKGNKRLDKMTDITNREIAKLIEYRAALITAAVTGRIDVRATVVPTPEPTLTDAL